MNEKGPKKFDADEFHRAVAQWRKRMEQYHHDVPPATTVGGPYLPPLPRDQRLPREPGEEG